MPRHRSSHYACAYPANISTHSQWSCGYRKERQDPRQRNSRFPLFTFRFSPQPADNVEKSEINFLECKWSPCLHQQRLWRIRDMVRGRLPMLTGNQGKSRHNSSRRLFVWVEHFSLCRKKGYSGTAIFAQNEPTAVQEDFQPEDHVGEGRAITLDTGDFYLVNTYVPNAQGELAA